MDAKELKRRLKKAGAGIGVNAEHIALLKPLLTDPDDILATVVTNGFNPTLVVATPTALRLAHSKTLDVDTIPYHQITSLNIKKGVFATTLHLTANDTAYTLNLTSDGSVTRFAVLLREHTGRARTHEPPHATPPKAPETRDANAHEPEPAAPVEPSATPPPTHTKNSGSRALPTILNTLVAVGAIALLMYVLRPSAGPEETVEAQTTPPTATATVQSNETRSESPVPTPATSATAEERRGEGTSTTDATPTPPPPATTNASTPRTETAPGDVVHIDANTGESWSGPPAEEEERESTTDTTPPASQREPVQPEPSPVRYTNSSGQPTPPAGREVEASPEYVLAFLANELELDAFVCPTNVAPLMKCGFSPRNVEATKDRIDMLFETYLQPTDRVAAWRVDPQSGSSITGFRRPEGGYAISIYNNAVTLGHINN